MGFAGREALLAALDRLADAEPPATVVISAIAGTAGVGKTALAVQWAHRVADRFPDGQLYVNLRGFDPSGAVMSQGELHSLGLALSRPAPVAHRPDAGRASVSDAAHRCSANGMSRNGSPTGSPRGACAQNPAGWRRIGAGAFVVRVTGHPRGRPTESRRAP